MKTCSKCDAEKPLSEYTRHKTSAGGLLAACKTCAAGASRAYRAANFKASKAREVAYAAANLVHLQAYRAQYRADNIARVRERDKAYSAANRERLREYKAAHYAANQVAITAKVRAYCRANPDTIASLKAAYRAKKRNVSVGRVSPKAVFERDGWICYLCSEPVDRAAPAKSPRSPVLEHGIALAKGGAHAMDNVFCAHWSCNARKGTRPWWECTIMMK